MTRAQRMLATFLAAVMVLGAIVIVGAMAMWVVSDKDAPPSAVVAMEIPPTVEPVNPGYPVQSSQAINPDAGWVRRTAQAAGIPEVAMRAYGRAAILAARDLKGCNIGWNTLAAVGWVESHHGTIDERTLNADGTPSRPILGPVLDGKNFAAIPATPESKQWHDDPRWDRAVGPLQFITDSWTRWGTDADGDGVANPHDLDDAAWTAARYLCASGADLTTGAGWNRAVLSYNRSEEYAAQVFRAATTYASRVR